MSDGSAHQISVELPQSADFPQTAPQAAPEIPQPSQQPAQQSAQQASEPQYSEYARGLLDQVPEADRSVVGKYLPQWDAAIQRQAAQLEATVAPYIPLAQYGISSQDANLLAQLYDMLDTNPQGALDLVNQIVQRNQSDSQGQQYQQQQYPQQQFQQQQYGQQGQQAPPIHPQLEQQMAKMGQMMETMAQAQLRQQQAASEAAEDAALENYISWLRQEKGDFDEGYVLSQLELGVDGAAAVDAFNSMVQQRAAQSGQNGQQFGMPQVPGMQPPPVLNGGSAAVGNLPLSRASDQQRRAVVAQMLNAANQQGN